MLIKPDREAPAQAQAEAPAYDFDYLCRCLGMIPLGVDGGAVNLNTILYIQPVVGFVGAMRFHLPEGIKLVITPEEMVELEKRLRAREAEVARIRAEAIERDAQHQINAQMKAANDAMATAALQNKLSRRGS